MKRLYQIAMIVGAMIFCFDLSAQSLERQVIASGGAVQSATGVEVSSTVGESATATHSSGTVILNQGFQQGELISTSIEENKIHLDYTIYPNPTSDRINVNLTSDKNIDGVVTLTTIEGKQLFSNSIKLRAGQAFRVKYNLQNFSQGTYLLTIRGNSGKAQVVERIQKIN
jgi:hypothetical protein